MYRLIMGCIDCFVVVWGREGLSYQNLALQLVGYDIRGYIDDFGLIANYTTRRIIFRRYENDGISEHHNLTYERAQAC